MHGDNTKYPVQTRSEENGLKFFRTLQEATDHAKKDLTVWKISFQSETGERVRLVKRGGEFVYEPMEKAVQELKKERGI